MTVKVYGAAKAACVQRVLLCLIEKGIDFQIVHLDLDTMEHKSPDFLLRQPFGLVPAIEDGDLKLFESRAIARYYASKYSEQGSNLVGSTLEERAMVDQWVEVEAHQFNDPVYTIVMQLVVLPRMGLRPNMELVHAAEIKLGKVLDVYEKRLSETNYLAGIAFSLADLTHLPGLRYLVEEAGKGHLVTGRKNVLAWWLLISSRPSWKKLLHVAGY